MKSLRPFVRTLTALAVLGVAIAPLSAATLIVPVTHPTIVNAVNAASAGDTISIRPGLYKERITVNKQLSFEGDCADPTSVIVDAGRRFPMGMDGIGFNVQVGGVSIACLTVRHGTAGIFAEADDLAVVNVHLVHQRGEVSCGALFLGDICDSGGDGLHVRGDRFGIHGVNVVGPSDDCMDIAGDDGQVMGSLMSLCQDDGLDLEGQRNAIESNTAVNCDGAGLYVSGDDNVAKFNYVSRSDDDGIYMEGDRNEASHNEIGVIDGDGIDVEGSYGIVLDNHIAGIVEDNGIEVNGDHHEVRDNHVVHAGDKCFDVYGDDALLQDNTAMDCGENGFYVSGRNGEIRSNTSERTGEDGIEVFCGNDDCVAGGGGGGGRSGCGDLTIVDNVVNGTGRLHGIRVFGDQFRGGCAAGGTGEEDEVLIQGNVVDNATEHCFELEVSHGQILENTARGCDDGFDIDGNDLDIVANIARHNADDGISANGYDLFVQGNEVQFNGEDGLDVGDDTLITFNQVPVGNTIRDNFAELNHAEGIQNGGTLTILIGNVSLSNRKDCAREAGGTTLINSGNFCADGSNFFQLQQID